MKNDKRHLLKSIRHRLPSIFLLALIGYTTNLKILALLYPIVGLLIIAISILFEVYSVQVSDGTITIAALSGTQTYALNRSAIIDYNSKYSRLVFPDGKDISISNKLLSQTEWKELLAFVMNAQIAEQGAAANP